MPFTHTWNAAFNNAPSDADDAKEGAARIRDTRLATKERLAVCLSMAGDANDGKVVALNFLEQAADPTNAANEGFVFCKDVGGITEVFYMDSAGTVTQLTSNGKVNGIPPGSITAYAGGGVPGGWLQCAGQAVSRATYADLFAAIGVTYGPGDGATTFNVPNILDRTLVGAGQSYVIGATGGETNHTLTTNEMPVHSHGVTDPGHAHSYQIWSSGAPTSELYRPPSQDNNDGRSTTQASATGISIQNAGGGAAHNNMPPYLATLIIIKT